MPRYEIGLELHRYSRDMVVVEAASPEAAADEVWRLISYGDIDHDDFDAIDDVGDIGIFQIVPLDENGDELDPISPRGRDDIVTQEFGIACAYGARLRDALQAALKSGILDMDGEPERARALLDEIDREEAAHKDQAD